MLVAQPNKEQNQEPPWGRRPNSGPEDFITQLIDKLQDFFSDDGERPSEKNPPPGGAGLPPFVTIAKVMTFLFGIVILYGVYSSCFRIAPSEVGVVLRLGKYSQTTPPGLHFKLPYIDTLHKVDVQKVRREEFGFTSQRSSSNRNRRNYDMESLMITADKNVIDVAWIVQYKVDDPYAWLFSVANVQQALRDMSESVTRRIIGNMDFDYVLDNRDLFAAAVKQELQKMLDGLFPVGRSGVVIGTVQFKDINPPDPVKPAFNEVNEADQDMKRLVNEAQEIYNRVIPKARGNAKKIVEEAYGYHAKRVNEAKGEVHRFSNILSAYKDSPKVTRQRLYLEAMQHALPKVKNIYVIDKTQQTPIPLLSLGESVHIPNAAKK